MDKSRMWLRWLLLGLAWIAWAIAMYWPVGSRRLISIYYETAISIAVGPTRTRPIADAATAAFALLSILWFFSPALTALSASGNRLLLRLRFSALLLPFILFVAAFLIYQNGPIPAFFLLALSHLLACAAIMPWPTKTSAHGFEIIPKDQ